jgi:hypothetical protein
MTPMTPQPRDKRAFNAYRHGLTGHVLVITPDDELAYKHHCQGIHQSLAPSGAFETDLAQQIADDRWRMKRASAIETNMLAIKLNHPDTDLAGHPQVDAALATSRAWDDQQRTLDRLTLYESRIQRNIDKNFALLEKLQQQRREALQRIVEEAAILGETYDFPTETLPPNFVFSRPQITRLVAHYQRLQSHPKPARRAA